jgi:hypothetical protein
MNLSKRLREDLLFEIRRGWKAYAVIGFLVAAVIVLYAWRNAWLHADGTPVQATISSIGSPPLSEKYSPGTFEVVAVTTDGMYGRIGVSGQRMVGCQVGDIIPATKIGSSLRLEPRPCRTGPAD